MFGVSPAPTRGRVPQQQVRRSLWVPHTSLLDNPYGPTATCRNKTPAPIGRTITPRLTRHSHSPWTNQYFFILHEADTKSPTPWLCTPTAAQRHFTASGLWESSPEHLIQTKKSCPASYDHHWHFHKWHIHCEQSHPLLIMILELVENTGSFSPMR